MTKTLSTGYRSAETVARNYPHRWRTNRAGMVNVWYYYDTTFECSGGRWVLRGTNGSGKSRALEMLLPFLLDADRRKMDATGSGKVRLQDLMKAGSAGSRVGYLWLELERELTTDESPAGGHEHLTLGAYIKFSQSTGDAKVWYFTTPLRVGQDLVLLSSAREALSRDQLTALVGADRITESSETHRDRVRAAVYGLTGESGRERFSGLMQLMHTLRSPDVGNRIEEGRLPQILSDALPPLSEAALNMAGEQLDGLSETRAGQERLELAHRHVNTFLGTYRCYVTGVLAAAAAAAEESASTAVKADQQAVECQIEHRNLNRQHAHVQGIIENLATAESELDATVTGLKSSAAYASARDLDDRERKISALARSADSALSEAAAARRTEASYAADAATRADDAVQAAKEAAQVLLAARDQLRAAGAPPNIAETAAVRTLPVTPLMDIVRARREADPETVARPMVEELDVTPADIPAEQARLALVFQAAKVRQGHAATRLEQARHLEKKEHEVIEADDRADEEQVRAERVADEAAQACHRLDIAVSALAEQWHTWTRATQTSEALGEVDFAHGPLAEFLADPDSSPAKPALLETLDRLANVSATSARQRHAASLAALETAERADRLLRSKLEEEQAKLSEAVDLAPEGPTWLVGAPEGSVPLWQAVDFADGVSDADRAGIEAALLASGLLMGSVAADGTLRADDGQMLLRGAGKPVGSSLMQVLKVDPAAAHPDAVTAVLERVAYGHSSHSTWISNDGTWSNGPLMGRHIAARPKHIGAAARANARALRLSAINAELSTLDAAAAERKAAREDVVRGQEQLEIVVISAPRSQAVATAAALAAAMKDRSKTASEAALKMLERAKQLRRQWSTALHAHRDACDAFSLPTGADSLRQVQQDAHEAAKLCDSASQALQRVGVRLVQHDGAVESVRMRADERAEAEVRADSEWRTWHSEEAEFLAIRATVGADAAIVRNKLRAAQEELGRIRGELITERSRESGLSKKAGHAESEAATAGERATAAHRDLEAAGARLRKLLDLPGVAATISSPPLGPLSFAEFTVTSVRAAVDAVAAAVHEKKVADENALIRAQQTLEREIIGTFDVLAEVREGVRIIELSDATGRRTIAAAAEALSRQREEGRAALSDRERHVFTDFVLGGVADELRRRLDHASTLVAAMNTSLSSIRTSQGIGVQLRWNLAENSGPPLARIRELVTTPAALRTPEATSELTDLLKARVEESFIADASAGYAEHLRNAMDYRSWHKVDVLVLGPAPGQQRRLTRGAKLSQGETRFVSYVTLFAAVDAYLSGLPACGRALRLLLLDDAFAMVDDPTIAELMGLLVRLDIDFVMTGHALWGMYPQVPALDCYEVRRRSNGPAVTTHTHWDGRNRHLRAAQ